MIKIRNVIKYFGELKVLSDISLDVKRGEVISIIGSSGSGKSTLLRSLVKLEKIDEGLIEIEENSIDSSPDIVRKMGMVFQSFNLFPHKTVLQNIIEAPMMVKKLKKNDAIALAEDLLFKVGLLDKKNSYPAQISGGQKQRVAIARALAMQPKILLFDEPTSALDPELVGEVLNVIKDLAKDKMTLLIVTHEMAFAREVSDRIIFMDQGEIIADTVPEEFFTNSKNKRVKTFIEKML